jgi:G-patch domain
MSKVSFTVRRPTPDSRATSAGPDSDDTRFKLPALPRHLASHHSPNNSTLGSPLAGSSPKRSANNSPDSSDEENDQPTDELVTGFDRFGVQRCVFILSSSKRKRRGPQLTSAPSIYPSVIPRPEPQGPLVIPALQNRDWRELARRRRGGPNGKMYVPPSGEAGTGADGSVGGLGTREMINSGPQLEGLQNRKRTRIDITGQDAPVESEPPVITVDQPRETEDQRAIRALLADAEGGEGPEGPTVDLIPMADSGPARRAPTEDDAFKQDVDELPDEATLDDYDRIPVSQFGAAMLRGMGWKPGEPASRDKKRGIVEPWLPSSRPALLGIGAKEREVLDDGSGKKMPSRPERKYVPLIRKESERSSSPRSQPPSRSGSRRTSRSPPRRERNDDDKDRRRDRDRERDGHSSRDRESERERDRRRDRERSPRSSRRDRDYR